MAELDLIRVRALYETRAEISAATGGKTDHGKILRDAIREAQEDDDKGRGERIGKRSGRCKKAA